MASSCPVRLEFRGDYLPNNEQPIQYQSSDFLLAVKNNIPRYNFRLVQDITLLDVIESNDNNDGMDYMVGILSVWFIVTFVLILWIGFLLTCRYKYQKTSMFSGKRPITDPPPIGISTSTPRNSGTAPRSLKNGFEDDRGDENTAEEGRRLREDLPSSQEEMIVDEKDDSASVGSDDALNLAFLQEEDDEDEEGNDQHPPLALQPTMIPARVLSPSSPSRRSPSNSCSSPPQSPKRQARSMASAPKSPKIAPSSKDTPLHHPHEEETTDGNTSTPSLSLLLRSVDDDGDDGIPNVSVQQEPQQHQGQVKVQPTSTQYDEYVRYLKSAASSRPNLSALIGNKSSGDTSTDSDEWLLEEALSDPEKFLQHSLSLTLPPTPTEATSNEDGEDEGDGATENISTAGAINGVNYTTAMFDSLNTTDTSFPNHDGLVVPLPGEDLSYDDNGNSFMLFHDDADTSGETQDGLFHRDHHHDVDSENSLQYANQSQAIIGNNSPSRRRNHSSNRSASTPNITNKTMNLHHQPYYSSASFSSPSNTKYDNENTGYGDQSTPTISNNSSSMPGLLISPEASMLPRSNYTSQAASRKRSLENYVASFRESSTSFTSLEQGQQLHGTSFNNNNDSLAKDSQVLGLTSAFEPVASVDTRSYVGLVGHQSSTSLSNLTGGNMAFASNRSMNADDDNGYDKRNVPPPPGDDDDNDDDDVDVNITFQYDITNNTNAMEDTLQFYDLSAYERDQEEEEKKEDDLQPRVPEIEKEEGKIEALPEQRPSTPQKNPMKGILCGIGNPTVDDDGYGEDRPTPRAALTLDSSSHRFGDIDNHKNKPNSSWPISVKNSKYDSQRELAIAWKKWSKQEGRYECQMQCFRILVVLLSTLLIVSSLLFTLNGVVNLNEQTSSIQQSWQQDIQDKANQLDEFLQSLQQLQNSVLQQTWNIWQLLDQSCPLVADKRGNSSLTTRLIVDEDEDNGGICGTSYVCNVTGLPLEDEWRDWLQFARPDNVANLYEGENWTAVRIDLDRLFELDEDDNDRDAQRSKGNTENKLEGSFQNIIINTSTGMYFRWALWTTCACNCFLGLLALVIMAGTSLDFNFLDARWFGLIFWLFVFLAWVFATVFWIGTLVASDACSGGTNSAEGMTNTPNPVAFALLENSVQPDSFLANYWEYYLGGCRTEEYPSAVNDQVWLWSTLLPPTQRLANALESLDAIEFAQSCGSAMSPLSNAASVLSLQLCMVTQSMVSRKKGTVKTD